MSNYHVNITTGHRILEAMIRIFCHGNHGRKSGLWYECRKLLRYAALRLEKSFSKSINRSVPST